jgi:hypothetical protein
VFRLYATESLASLPSGGADSQGFRTNIGKKVLGYLGILARVFEFMVGGNWVEKVRYNIIWYGTGIVLDLDMEGLKDILGMLGVGAAGGAVVVVCCCCMGKKRRKRGAERLLLELRFENNKIKGNIMAVSLTSTQFVEGTLQPVDSKGRPAQVDENTVEYTSSNPDVFIVEEDPTDQLKIRITAVGEGVAELRYSADADLDDGETVTIEGFTAVEVLPAMAIGFGIQFGTPQEQPNSTSTTSTTTV